MESTDQIHLGHGFYSSYIYPNMVGRPVCSEVPIARLEKGIWGEIEIDDTNEYVPSTWDTRAYANIFEKFKARERKYDLDPAIEAVAMEKLLKEIAPMRGCKRKAYENTTANAKSNPGYPWKEFYSDEEAVRDDHGYLPVYQMARDRDRPLWYSFLKKEMLKKKKVENNDIRMIMCPPWNFKRIQASFDENQNEKMKQYTLVNECQVGWCPVKRGLDTRIRAIAKGRDVYTTVDYTRYDGTIPTDVLLLVRQIRSDLLDVNDADTELLDWVNTMLLDKTVLLANGRIVKITGGNPSGQVSTSIDNCLVNTYITAASNAQWYFEQTGTVPTLKQLEDWYDQLVYGDDRIGAYSSRVCIPPTVRFIVDFFADYFGMWVKDENVIMSRTLNGLEFCGMKLHYDGRTDTWVGIYKADKIKAAIVNPVKPAPDPEILKAKLGSAKILLAYDNDSIDWIAEKERDMDAVVHTEFQIPTLTEAKKLWTDQKGLQEIVKAF
uniref:Non-structural polyprotein 1AB n=1 Tax=Beihai fish astrovirus 1 TaxID=2116127 RepID=A0A2P1GNC2_9VIRU|nr:ORF1b [Beihai fish astrovirus 1]